MLIVAVELSKALVAHKGKDEFTLLCSQERPAALEITDEWITEIYDEIVETIKTGSPAQKKALAKRLIVQVEIDGKVACPTYRVPTAVVRIVGTLVDPRGFEPLTS
jgi:hypothetical protein